MIKSFGQQEIDKRDAIVLSALNNCTPLPKDLQLLILEYYTCKGYLIAYVEPDPYPLFSSQSFSNRSITIKWKYLFRDNANQVGLHVPSTIQLKGTLPQLFQYKQGLLVTYKFDYAWHKRYYPFRYSNHSSGLSDYETIPSASEESAFNTLVLGKQYDQLVVFDIRMNSMQRYDSERKQWSDKLPFKLSDGVYSSNCKRSIDGRLYLFPTRATSLALRYDDVRNVFEEIGSGLEDDCRVLVDTITFNRYIVYHLISNTRNINELQCLSIDDWKVRDPISLGSKTVICSLTDGLLIADSDVLSFLDPLTGEMVTLYGGLPAQKGSRTVLCC